MSNFFKRVLGRVSPMEMKLRLRERAEHDLVLIKADLEYNTAMRDMLEARLARLEKEGV